MRTSDMGLAMIRHHEGCETEAYPDPGSDDGHPWTIGVGHTQGVKKGDTCTVAQATEWLREDVHDAEAAVLRLAKVPLTQAQFDSLVSFVFNVGTKAFADSTLLRMLNSGDYFGAAVQFERWNKNDGRVMAGLTRRRKAERDVFENGYA
jgi:lysozyme